MASRSVTLMHSAGLVRKVSHRSYVITDHRVFDILATVLDMVCFQAQCVLADNHIRPSKFFTEYCDVCEKQTTQFMNGTETWCVAGHAVRGENA